MKLKFAMTDISLNEPARKWVCKTNLTLKKGPLFFTFIRI